MSNFMTEIGFSSMKILNVLKKLQCLLVPLHISLNDSSGSNRMYQPTIEYLLTCCICHLFIKHIFEANTCITRSGIVKEIWKSIIL